MKKFAYNIAVLTLMFAIMGCPDGGGGRGRGGGGGSGNSASTRKFWAQNAANGTFYQLDAERLVSNSRCEVWAEKESGVTAATANSVANAYNTVYTKMMNVFGYKVYITDAGKTMDTLETAHYLATGRTSGAKLTILLLDIRDGYKKDPDPFVGGYFYAVDLLKNDPNDPQAKYSNALDMIYLDTYPSVPGSSASNGTLAHEMQHLMNFVSTVVFNRTRVMDTWIDEGLSSAAEWVYSGQHPEVRWKYYNEDPSGLIAKGNSFFVWGNREDNPLANLDDYSTVYLFFQYLRLQSGKPNDIYFDIHKSGFSDYQAITTATNINSSHTNNWQLLLRDWYAANYTNDTSGLYGYRNDPALKTIKAPMVAGSTNSLPLFPGEGVYSRTTTAESVPPASGNIRYAGLGSTGSTPNDSTGYAGGARLTYNVNTDIKGASVTGSTTGIAPSIGISIPFSASVQIGSKKFTGPFMVDMGYFNRKNGNNSAGMETIKTFDTNNSRSINKNNNTVKCDISTLERVFIDE